MTLDSRLVNKAKDEPRDGLAQQGKVHIELAKQYAADLDDNGWSGADSAAGVEGSTPAVLGDADADLESGVGVPFRCRDERGGWTLPASEALSNLLRAELNQRASSR